MSHNCKIKIHILRILSDMNYNVNYVNYNVATTVRETNHIHNCKIKTHIVTEMCKVLETQT